MHWTGLMTRQTPSVAPCGPPRSLSLLGVGVFHQLSKSRRSSKVSSRHFRCLTITSYTTSHPRPPAETTHAYPVLSNNEGAMDTWLQLTSSTGSGPPRASGEVHCVLSFVGASGVAYPQHQPGVESFDDSLHTSHTVHN